MQCWSEWSQNTPEPRWGTLCVTVRSEWSQSKHTRASLGYTLRHCEIGTMVSATCKRVESSNFPLLLPASPAYKFLFSPGGLEQNVHLGGPLA